MKRLSDPGLDKNPLAGFVGKPVPIVGTHRGHQLEATVHGQPIRDGGKLPWAGRSFVVGKTHPDWHDWMAGGESGNGNPPGLGKKSTP